MSWNEFKRRMSARTPAPMDATHRCAVLVPLVEREGEVHLLYELRAAALRTQPGEVCFPGGGMEAGESAVDCALRETQEELGISPDDIEILGELDFICHRSGLVLYPILAQMQASALDRMTLNPEEVDEVFTIPLSALRAMPIEEYAYDLIPAPGADFPYERLGISKDYPWRKAKGSFSVYRWQEKIVWGLTGCITRHLLSLLDEV